MKVEPRRFLSRHWRQLAGIAAGAAAGAGLGFLFGCLPGG